MKKLFKQTRKILPLILGIFFLGCGSDDTVIELPSVVAGFTSTINAATGSATFTNTSTNATNYAWDFGDGNTSTERNPVKIFADGTYTVSLTASNNAGASDIFEDDITIVITTDGGDGGDGGGVVVCTGIEETEQSLSAADFNLTFQTDPTDSIISDNAGFSWINNPDTDNEVNTSCKVGQIDRTDASAFANNQIELDAKLDFSANAGFKLKVWSPNAATSVLLKLEDKTAPGTFTETFATTTLVGAWEELTFPFAIGENGKYDKIVLFFELDTNTAETYYIDDMALYVRVDGGDGGTIGGSGTDDDNLITNGGFETGDTTGWETDIAGNSGVFNATDAVSKCETYSGGFTANEAQLMIIRQSNIGVGVVTPNSDITISFDLLGASGDGGVFIAQVFSESTTAGVTKTDILNDGNPIALSANWTRYSFTTTTGPDVTNGITLLLKTECGAVAGCAVNANIDNVYVAIGTTGGPDCDGGTVGGDTGGGDTGGGDTGGGDTGTGNGVELVENGDFETGLQAPWLFFDSATTNGGTTSLDNTDSSGGGSFSARVQSGPGNNPGIKLERFAIGTIMANQSVEVKVDAKLATLEGGAIINVLAFSESATEGAPAVLHNLGQINGATGAWSTSTFSFTTASDVTGGISVLMEVVCGGVPGCDGDVLFDNISVQIVE